MKILCEHADIKISKELVGATSRRDYHIASRRNVAPTQIGCTKNTVLRTVFDKC